MWTRSLAANMETQRGATAKAAMVQYGKGNTTIPAGTGSGLFWYAKVITAFGAPTSQIKTKAFRLGDLKRMLIKSGGNPKGILGLLGRAP